MENNLLKQSKIKARVTARLINYEAVIYIYSSRHAT
jgi:hypothetical protein